MAPSRGRDGFQTVLCQLRKLRQKLNTHKPPAIFQCGDSSRAGSREWVNDNIARLTTAEHTELCQCDWHHGRVRATEFFCIDGPNVALVLSVRVHQCPVLRSRNAAYSV